MFEPIVKGDDVKDVQMLPLVFVKPFDLNVEKGVRIDGNPGYRLPGISHEAPLKSAD
jgi:hypothetical protein